MVGRICDFVVVGAQKAGTTAAAFNLGLHPDVSVFAGVTSFGQREIEFFNQHWEEGVDWYRTHFDSRKTFVGEKTAELLHRTVTHQRMYEVIPEAKLIVLLRCPVERAFSQWRMATRSGWGEMRPFAEVVEDELAVLDQPEHDEAFYYCRRRTTTPWREGYLLKGFYLDQILSLLKWFPRERIHVAISERVRRNMAAAYNEMFHFIGATSFCGEFAERFVGTRAYDMEGDVVDKLVALYRPANTRLFEWLGYEISEWRQ